jgi:hypothetical protein
MKHEKAVITVVIVLLGVLFFSLSHRIGLHCTSYFDLGIYSDALNRIKPGDWNPFLPGRNIRIFNDHFDPILIPFSFLTRWIKAPILGTGLEFLALVLCWFPLRRLERAGKISPRDSLFAYAFLLLNHATVDAVQSPFHPTTWGVLPLLCVFTFYWLGEFRNLITSLLLLYSCREEFPLLGTPLALTLLFLDGKRKEGTLILALTLVWIGFVFGIRPRVFEGRFENYGASLLKGLLADPLGLFQRSLAFDSLRMFLERTFPILMLIDISRIQTSARLIFRFLLIASPILLIRFVSHQWTFHYGTAAVVAWIFTTISLMDQKAARWRWGVSILFLTGNFIAQPIKILANTDKRCPASSERLAEIAWGQRWLAGSGHSALLMENNLASTQFLRSSKAQSIHLLCSPTGMAIRQFDAVLVEKPPSGDPWPCTHDRIEKWMVKWRSDPRINVIRDNQMIFLAEGPISSDP